MNENNKELEALIEALDKCGYEVVGIEHNPDGAFRQIDISITPTPPEMV